MVNGLEPEVVIYASTVTMPVVFWLTGDSEPPCPAPEGGCEEDMSCDTGTHIVCVCTEAPSRNARTDLEPAELGSPTQIEPA